MKNLRKPRGLGGMWKLLVVFVLSGYTISTVLAFDVPVSPKKEAETIATTRTATQNLHTQIENDVALSARKVWNNLVQFMQEGISSPSEEKPEAEMIAQPNPSEVPSSQGQEKQSGTPGAFITNFTQSETSVLPAYTDIQQDINRASIETLAARGILDASNDGKYHPNNHVRCSDFIRVIIDTYRDKRGYSPESSEGLSTMSHLTLKNPNTLLAKKLNTAKELGLLEGVKDMIRDHPITQLQVQQIFNNILSLDPSLANAEMMFLIEPSSSVLTKSDMARIVTAFFQLEKQPRDIVFRDIRNHRYQDAITQLAQLGVVAGRNGNFYPENKVLRADGVIMIVNSLFAKQQKALIIKNFDHLNTITDVTYFATYAPHLEYLLDKEIGTSLLRYEPSGYLFLPDAILTKGEAYQLISQAAGIKILNIQDSANSESLTRGELAQLLVDAFELGNPKYEESGFTLSEPIPKEATDLPKEKEKSLLISLLKEVVNQL